MKRVAIVIYQSEDSEEGDKDYIRSVLSADNMQIDDIEIEKMPRYAKTAQDYISILLG